MSLENILYSPIRDTVEKVSDRDQWNVLKEKLIGDLPDRKASQLSIILDNVIKDTHMRSGIKTSLLIPEGDTTSTASSFNNITLPLTAKVFPQLIAHDLIGVQIIPRPVSMIPLLRYTLEPEIKLELKTAIVEAKTRRMGARWMIEDNESDHNYKEKLNIISQNIATEFDCDLLRGLHNLLPPVESIYDENKLSEMPTFVDDSTDSLVVLINRQANQIAIKTRHHKGNWCVVSPYALRILQASPLFCAAKDASRHKSYTGILCNSIHVYCNECADDDTSVLIGYKGHSESDTGVVYCPLVLIQKHGVITNPNTFESIAGFITRYGWGVFNDHHLGDSSAYYGSVGIKPAIKSFV